MNPVFVIFTQTSVPILSTLLSPFPQGKERKLFVIQNMEQSLSVIQKLKLPPISMIIFISMILFPITAHLTFIATKVAANALI